MALKGLKKSNKNPPILSHEFVIQNHADIVSCVAMVFVLGLMFQATSPLASLFITVQHNATEMDMGENLTYTTGVRDIAAIFFYCLISIVMHAIIQEYILDKINRKLHLSKTKHSKFNESGQLLIFTLVSTGWGINIIMKDNILGDMGALWSGYPDGHAQMSFMLKFFFLIHLSYWLHCYPELYFQKTKRDEMPARIQYATLYLFFIGAAYALNFTHVALVLLILRYVEDAVLHMARLLYFAERHSLAYSGFKLWNVLFVVCRLASIIVTILTFYYGLATNEDQTLNLETGNFNTPVIRFNCLIGGCLIQGFMMWNFINFHLRRLRERQAAAIAARKKAAERKATKKPKKDDSKHGSEEDVSELTEVDQNTRRRK